MTVQQTNGDHIPSIPGLSSRSNPSAAPVTSPSSPATSFASDASSSKLTQSIPFDPNISAKLIKAIKQNLGIFSEGEIPEDDLKSLLKILILKLEQTKTLVKDLDAADLKLLEGYENLLRFGCLKQRCDDNSENDVKALAKHIAAIYELKDWLIRKQIPEKLQNRQRTIQQNIAQGNSSPSSPPAQTQVPRRIEEEARRILRDLYAQAVAQDLQALPSFINNDGESPIDGCFNSLTETRTAYIGSIKAEPGRIKDRDFFITDIGMNDDSDPGRSKTRNIRIDHEVQDLEIGKINTQTRSKKEIDIKIPIESELGKPASLPTLLGTRAKRLEFPDYINTTDLKIYQDDLGITYIEGLPAGQIELKYRLVEDPSLIRQNILPEPETEDSSHRIIDKESWIYEWINSAASNQGKLERICTFLRANDAIYTKNKELNLLLNLAPNYYRAQEAIGFMGDCFHLHCITQKLMKEFKIPNLYASGLVVGQDRFGNYKFKSPSSAHIKELYYEPGQGIKENEPTQAQVAKIDAKDHCFRDSLAKLLYAKELGDEEYYAQLKSESGHWRNNTSNKFSPPYGDKNYSEFLAIQAEKFLEEYNQILAAGCPVAGESLVGEYNKLERSIKLFLEQDASSKKLIELYYKLKNLKTRTRDLLEANPDAYKHETLNHRNCLGFPYSIPYIQECLEKGDSIADIASPSRYSNFSKRAEDFIKRQVQSLTEKELEEYLEKVLRPWDWSDEDSSKNKVWDPEDFSSDCDCVGYWIDSLAKSKLIPEEISLENGEVKLSSRSREILRQEITISIKNIIKHKLELNLDSLINLAYLCRNYDIELSLSQEEKYKLLSCLLEASGAHRMVYRNPSNPEPQYPRAELVSSLTSSDREDTENFETVCDWLGGLDPEKINEAVLEGVFGHEYISLEAARKETLQRLATQGSELLLPVFSNFDLWAILRGNKEVQNLYIKIADLDKSKNHYGPEIENDKSGRLKKCLEAIPEQEKKNLINAYAGSSIDPEKIKKELLRRRFGERFRLMLPLMKRLQILIKTYTNKEEYLERLQKKLEQAKKTIQDRTKDFISGSRQVNQDNTETLYRITFLLEGITDYFEKNLDEEEFQLLFSACSEIKEDGITHPEEGFEETENFRHANLLRLNPVNLIHILFKKLLETLSIVHPFTVIDSSFVGLRSELKTLREVEDLEIKARLDSNTAKEQNRNEETSSEGHGHNRDELLHLRNYRPGDLARDINHRAWARTGTPQVNIYAKAINQAKEQDKTNRHYVLDLRYLLDADNNEKILKVLKKLKEEITRTKNISFSICFEGEILTEFNTQVLANNLDSSKELMDKIGPRTMFENFYLFLYRLKQACQSFDKKYMQLEKFSPTNLLSKFPLSPELVEKIHKKYPEGNSEIVLITNEDDISKVLPDKGILEKFGMGLSIAA